MNRFNNWNRMHCFLTTFHQNKWLSVTRERRKSRVTVLICLKLNVLPTPLMHLRQLIAWITITIKIKVNIWVTFKDQWDSEVQSNIREQSKTQSNWQGPKERNFIISSHVPFATFHSNLSSVLNCWDHSHVGCEPVTLTCGLRHD